LESVPWYQYVDTGFFVDDVAVGGQAATLSSEPGKWLRHS
jgi:hypothetical protein